MNPSGRPKGIASKKQKAMREILQEHMETTYGHVAWDPVMRLAEIAEQSTTPLDLKIASLKAIIPYIHPALRAVDLKIGGDVAVRHTMIDKLTHVIENSSLEEALREIEGEVVEEKTAAIEDALDRSTTTEIPALPEQPDENDDPGEPDDASDA